MLRSSTIALVDSLVEIAARHYSPMSADSENTLRADLEQVLQRDFHDGDDFTAADANLFVAKLTAAEERARTLRKVLAFEDQTSRWTAWAGEGLYAGLRALPLVLLGVAALVWLLTHLVLTNPGERGPWSWWCLLSLASVAIVLLGSITFAACRAFLCPPRWQVVRTPYGVESVLVRRETGQAAEVRPEELAPSTSYFGRLLGLHWIKAPNVRCRFRVAMLKDVPLISSEARRGSHDVSRTSQEVATVLALLLVGGYSFARSFFAPMRQAFSWEEGSLLFVATLVVACVFMGWAVGAILSRNENA